MGYPDELYKEILDLYSETLNSQNLDKLTDKMAEFLMKKPSLEEGCAR